MFILFLILIINMLMSFKYKYAGIDNDYLSKENTQAIKGLFVAAVFFSHIRTYANYTHSTDLIVISVLNYLGQLMVTLFLFYSGYGVFESIKRKGLNYIKKLPKNRIGVTFFDFSFAIILFVLLGLYVGRKMTILQVLLSFIGWKSIGNSSWYMFSIFTLYFMTYFCFRFTYKNKFFSLCLMTLFSLIYVYCLSQIQPDRFTNTYLCYVAGMWYSYFKVHIDSILNKYNWLYYILAILIFGLYFYLYDFRMTRIMAYNLVSILFCLCFVFLSMKISFKSKLLLWLGKYLFWIYILQRIPMILFKYYGLHLYPYIYLVVCLAVTFIMSYYIDIFTAKLKKFIWKKT